MQSLFIKRHCSELRDPRQLKSLTTLLNRSGSHLQTLQLAASIHTKRAHTIQNLLPKNLKQKVATGDLNSGLLTLYVPTASLATGLRFEERTLIEKLQDDPLFRGIRRIQCRVKPLKSEAPQNAKMGNGLSAKSASFLQEFSESLTDEGFKRQFQRLAERGSDNLPPDQT
ncbi:MAG: hypothetical protein CMD87_01525 [Gammaproteobacteria bacterium]|nr:hypothetical protein [Gammaproteobacteria bacterium]